MTNHLTNFLISNAATGDDWKAAEEFVSKFGQYVRRMLEESQREAAHNTRMLLQHELKQLPWWKRIFVKGK